MEAAGIRVRYTYTSAEAVAPYLAISWRSHYETDFAKNHFKKYSPTGDFANWKQITWSRLNDPTATMTAWPCAKVQVIRISPLYAKGTLKIHDVTLLLAPQRK